MSKLVISLIRFYQKRISPLFGPKCRFYPTCSEYAVLAIKKYGLLKGLIKAMFRILRCNPLSKGEIDYP